MKLEADWRNKEFRDSYATVMTMNVKDFFFVSSDEFSKKYPPSQNMKVLEGGAIRDVSLFFDLIGIKSERY